MESNSTLTYTSTILATLSTSAQNGIGPIVLNSESEWNESFFWRLRDELCVTHLWLPAGRSCEGIWPSIPVTALSNVSVRCSASWCVFCRVVEHNSVATSLTSIDLFMSFGDLAWALVLAAIITPLPVAVRLTSINSDGLWGSSSFLGVWSDEKITICWWVYSKIKDKIKTGAVVSMLFL